MCAARDQLINFIKVQGLFLVGKKKRQKKNKKHGREAETG